MAKTKRATMKRKISIDLSDAQCLEIGKQQAEKELLYRRIENEAKASAGEYKGRLNKLWTEISELATAQKERKRAEEVEVVEIPDLSRQKITICRADNEQVLDTRDMTLTEMAAERQRDAAARQIAIPMADGKSAAAADDLPNVGQKIVKLDRKRKGKEAKSELPEDRDTAKELEAADTEPPESDEDFSEELQ